jgi:hypothetical protein
MMIPNSVPRLLAIAVLAGFLTLSSGAMARDYHSETGDSNLVIRWSQLAEDHAFALGTAVTDPFPNARGWTMMFLAMHDALNAIDPEYQQYAFFGSNASADPIAAAAMAAHRVMNYIYPMRQAENDAELDFWLGQVPEGLAKTAGIRLGTRSANAIIKARANDNMPVVGSYTPQDPPEPGEYQFTPPFDFVYRPAFGDSTTFGSGVGSSFLPGPPPALTSATYGLHVNEVQKLGELDSPFRTQDQTNLAAWWLEFNETQWSRFMRQLTETQNMDLTDAVRMFALGNMAQIDASVAVWFAKRHYDLWRPFHAIRLADTDDNERTLADPNWEPEQTTPPLWEYPSAHAAQCWAVAEVLKEVFGSDDVSFATESSTAPPENPVRSFNYLSQAATECGESRIMAGYHYRFSVNAGKRMGKRVGSKILSTQLTPHCPGAEPRPHDVGLSQKWSPLLEQLGRAARRQAAETAATLPRGSRAADTAG